MKNQKLLISRTSIQSKLPFHSSVTFILVMHTLTFPQWLTGIAWFLFVVFWLAAIWVIYKEVGNAVNPLDTYNQDPHPMEAYNQDMGIKKAIKITKNPDGTFKGKMEAMIKEGKNKDTIDN